MNKAEKIKEIGLYIHIPFCKQKCYYCDFISYANKEELEQRYVQCLNQEIIKYAKENEIMSKHNLEPQYIVKTIYIGGGTPSIIDEIYLAQIINTIKQNFKVKENAETTIEINPGTITKQKLETYKHYGINRLSIGLQAVQDEILQKIGRIHTYKDFQETYNMARQIGFDNINVDLMINLPGQTIEDLKHSIKNIISIKPEHISVYSLILEENTKMCQMVENGLLSLSSDEEEREMYWFVKEKLESHGYHHYEISNFAKKGFESQHNLDCWNQKEYIGIGLAASSYMDNKRYSNITNLEQYISNIENNTPNLNLILEEVQDEDEKISEFMMLRFKED